MKENFISGSFRGSSGSSGSSGSGSSVFDVAGLGAFSGEITSPLLAQALINTRGDLVYGRSPDQPRYELPAGSTRASNDLSAWDGEVRRIMCISEFLSAFTFNLEFRRLDPKQDGRQSIEVEPPSSEDLGLQVAAVLKAAELRDDRLAEILTQYAQPISFYAMVLNLNPDRHRTVFDLMRVVLYCGKSVVMEFKHHFNFPRVADICPDVDPVIQTPGHASYPAGHATETFMLSTILVGLLKGSSRGASLVPGAIEQQLYGLASRVSYNRVVAGLHYPMDNAAGKKLGTDLAQLMISIAGQNGHLNWLFGRASQELSA